MQTEVQQIRNISNGILDQSPGPDSLTVLSSWGKKVKIQSFYELDLQKSIGFLLYPFFVFRNELYVNLLYYMYTCCYTKLK